MHRHTAQISKHNKTKKVLGLDPQSIIINNNNEYYYYYYCCCYYYYYYYCYYYYCYSLRFVKPEVGWVVGTLGEYPGDVHFRLGACGMKKEAGSLCATASPTRATRFVFNELLCAHAYTKFASQVASQVVCARSFC